MEPRKGLDVASLLQAQDQAFAPFESELPENIPVNKASEFLPFVNGQPPEAVPINQAAKFLPLLRRASGSALKVVKNPLQQTPSAPRTTSASQASPTATKGFAGLKPDRETVRREVFNIAKSMGIPDSELPALDRLIMKESGYNPAAQNPTSTAFGVFQFLDSTRKNYGIPKNTDVATQTQAGLKYIKDRYGSPSKALEFHQKSGWY